MRQVKDVTISEMARNEIQGQRNTHSDEPLSAGYKGRLNPTMRKQALRENLRLSKMRIGGSDIRLKIDQSAKKSAHEKDVKMQSDDQVVSESMPIQLDDTELFNC